MYQNGYQPLLQGMYDHTVNWNEAARLALGAAKDDAALSNREISDITGIPEVSLQRYLAGTRNLTLDHFAVIARALGQDPFVLFGEVEARVQGNQ